MRESQGNSVVSAGGRLPLSTVRHKYDVQAKQPAGRSRLIVKVGCGGFFVFVKACFHLSISGRTNQASERLKYM